MRELAALVMRSHLHGMLLVGLLGAVSLIFLPAAFLSAAALGLVALRKGPVNAGVVAVGAFLPIVAASSLLPLRPGLGFPIVAVLWLPVLLGAWVLRRWSSQGMALLAVALLCVAGLIAMHLLIGDVVGFWRTWLSHAVAGVPGATVQGFERDGTLRLMNGLVGLFFGMAAMVSLFLARWMQSRLYYPGGFGSEFRSLGVPRMVLLGVVVILLLAGAAGRIILMDLFMIALMIYFFVGLAVIHGVVHKRNLPWMWAAPPYLALAMVPQYAVLAMAFLGALDGFMGFRRRG